MTFLELCKAAASDSGTIAGVPSFTTTVGATGRVLQMVGWVRDAWIDIQNERQDWLWMRKSFSKALTIGKRDYTAAELDITDLGAFRPDTPERRQFSLYDPTIGQADEGTLEQKSPDYYESLYDIGFTDPNRPTIWAVNGSGLWVGPAPDIAYVLRGKYRKTPQTLTADADIPEMPVAYHRLIVAEAIRLMARSDEAFVVLQEKSDMYSRLRNPLVLEQTPPASISEEFFA